MSTSAAPLRQCPTDRRAAFWLVRRFPRPLIILEQKNEPSTLVQNVFPYRHVIGFRGLAGRLRHDRRTEQGSDHGRPGVEKADEANANANAAKTAAAQASQKADQANATADGAKSTADQANSTANAAKAEADKAMQEVDKLAEKIDRMFKKTMQK